MYINTNNNITIEMCDYLCKNGYKLQWSPLKGIIRFYSDYKMIVVRDNEVDFYDYGNDNDINEKVKHSRLNGLRSLSIVNWKRILKETGFVNEVLTCVEITENFYNNHAGMLKNILS